MAVQASITDLPPLKSARAPEPVLARIPEGNGAAKPVVAPCRRFERPDIERHGAWLFPRFMERFPHLDQRQTLSFMCNVLYSNEFMFLFQDHGVALAQRMMEHTLQPKPVVWERFVFLENRENPRHVEEGLTFYREFARWTKQKHSDTLVVEQASDVPHDAIADCLGRIFSSTIQIARISKE